MTITKSPISSLNLLLYPFYSHVCPPQGPNLGSIFQPPVSHLAVYFYAFMKCCKALQLEVTGIKKPMTRKSLQISFSTWNHSTGFVSNIYIQKSSKFTLNSWGLWEEKRYSTRQPRLPAHFFPSQHSGSIISWHRVGSILLGDVFKAKLPTHANHYPKPTIFPKIARNVGLVFVDDLV